jgi:putative peptidoglycan lipid II flippase
VPQLVRAIRNDADRGEGYTQRIVTVAALFLAAVSVVLVAAAPWIVRLYFDGHTPADTADAVAFARYCLPQVFFYGMFVLVGQVLNAHGRFGPMMWAPIANNAVAIAVLVLYLVGFGASSNGSYSSGEELLLGLGSTAGIVVQLLVLLPYLRAAGFVYRPRLDIRGTGLSHTFALGVWTVLFVVVNQLAYVVVTRLATGGSAQDGTGYTIYAFSFLITQVPHSIVTVSLGTAILPRLSASAAAADARSFSRLLGSTLRGSLAIIVPFAALVPVIAVNLAHVLFGFGASAHAYTHYGPTLVVFAPGLVLFTIQYLMLRGYYAIEDTKRAFWNQCAVAIVNVAAAIVLVGLVSAEHVAPALAAAYGLAYLVGAILSYRGLSRRLGPLDGGGLTRFLVRLVVASAVAAVVAWLASRGLTDVIGGDGWLKAVVVTGVAGVVDLAILVVAARAMHLVEVTSVADAVFARLGRTAGRQR